MNAETALKSNKAFSKLLKAGYIETDCYQLRHSQTLYMLNRDGKYVAFLEHGQGFQVFTETSNHLTK